MSTLIQFLAKDRKLARAARLFFALKGEGVDKIHFNHIAITGFTRYQRETYIKCLVDAGWIGRDKNGVIYLRSWDRICEFKADGCDRPDMPPKGILQSQKDWIDWLMGKAILEYSQQIQSGKSKGDSVAYDVTKNGPGSILKKGRKPVKLSANPANSHGVSLENIMKHFGLSQASASRYRERGQKAGYQLLRWWLPVGGFIDGAFYHANGGFHDAAQLGVEYISMAGKLYSEMPSILFVG